MSEKKSKYAQKRDGGQQMYGPGCCAHKITDAQIANAKDRARRNGHFDYVNPKVWRAFDLATF
jgi:hypothetical protein